ncbi:MAG: hypothetical protein M1833_007076 [Piccolia ochrophora]|nr:MAG: hypothetical protein M1833_007076 [Piccolia ochrophora]
MAPTNNLNGSNSGTAEPVVFDETTIQALTGRIAKGLQHHNQQAAPDKKSIKRSPKSKAKHETTQPDHTSNKKTQDQKPPRKTPSSTGKISVPRKTHSKGQPGNKAHESVHAQLRQEAFGLGGTEDDLALLDGVDSASEYESYVDQQGDSKTRKKSLERDTVNLVRELGLQGQQSAAPAIREHRSSKNGKEVLKHAVAPVADQVQKSKTSKEAPRRTKADQVEPEQRGKKRKEPQRDDKATSLQEEPKPTLEARPDWYAVDLPELPPSHTKKPAPLEGTLKRIQEHATALLQAENEAYAKRHLTSSSSHRFLSTIMLSGTLSDKISALTLVVQESPVHAMKALEALVGLAKKRSRSQAITSLSAIKDLLAQGMLLPPDRKLRTLSHQPGLLAALQAGKGSQWQPGNNLPGQLKDIHLIYFAFEDWLKTTYFEVLKTLEIWSNDEVEYARARAVDYVYELLKEKPEQEANLLRMLVNKLGDPQRKIASKASHLLLQLQDTHPLMKPIIVAFIESELLLRPGQSHHAKYYAVITLNQTVLSGKEESVARKLLDIYFALFVILLKPSEEKSPHENDKGARPNGKDKKGKEEDSLSPEDELKEKIISAVLTGVNRAYPFAGTDDSSFQNNLNTLFVITHSANFNTSIQALLLIQQLTASKQIASDRFYRTLYESLLDPRLLTSSKQTMYLNLLFRSMKSDLNHRRTKAFIKRLVQVISLHQPAFACGVLYLIRDLENTIGSLKTLLNQPEEHDDDNPIDPTRSDTQNGVIDGNQSRTDPSKAPTYDGRKRDPEYSHAENSCLWELLPFEIHFHPSVALFASKLMRSDDKMPAKPDMSLHTLTHFLDRFVYRNAKASTAPQGTSIMQPLAGENSREMLLSHRAAGRMQAPLNIPNFWNRKQEDISVDEVFFHKYFAQMDKGRTAAGRKKTEKTKTRATHDSDEDADENEIWDALVGSRPELEGSEADDSDLDLESLGSEGEDLEKEEEVEYHSDVDGAASVKDGSDGDIPMGFESEESLVGSDEDLPLALSNADEPIAAEASVSKDRKSKRRKLKHLPTFASAEDYAQMLGDDDEELV